jgi:hypothetical protein
MKDVGYTVESRWEEAKMNLPLSACASLSQSSTRAMKSIPTPGWCMRIRHGRQDSTRTALMQRLLTRSNALANRRQNSTGTSSRDWVLDTLTIFAGLKVVAGGMSDMAALLE